MVPYGTACPPAAYPASAMRRPIVRAQDLAHRVLRRALAHAQQLDPQVARLQGVLAALDRRSGAGAAPPDVVHVAAPWFAARALLDEVATLRADTAEALHHLRRAHDADPD